jgi:RNA polymerase-binding transcription factor DksA
MSSIESLKLKRARAWRKWYLQNKEYNRIRVLKWKHEHREDNNKRYREYHREWRRKNPEKAQKQRDAEKAKRKLFRKKGLCYACGQPLPATPKKQEV